MLRKTQPNYYLVFLAFILLIGFGAVAVATEQYPLNSLDVDVAAFVQSFETPSLTVIMKLFTAIGSTKACVAIILLVMIFLYFVLKHRIELIFFSVAVGGSAVLNQILKGGFQRERPNVYRLIEESGYSFPSGHTMGALALYGALAFLLWRHISTKRGRALLLIGSGFMIAMIGISRIYLGVHYPSDIIGAMLLSGCWLTLTIGMYQWYMKNREMGSSPNLEAGI